MPSAWKKAKLGEVPRLLASALGSGARRGVAVGDSPLVLQAGFPTSVADLLVKNRGRLRTKTPRWLRGRSHPGPGDHDAEAGGSAAPSLTSEIPVGPPPASLQQEEREEEKQRSLARRETTSGEGLGRSPMEKEEEDASREAEGATSEASTREEPEPEKDALQARNPWGFVAMPTKVVFLVLVLAIGTQKIAFGASISAFAVLLLESMGRRLIPSPKPCEESSKKKKKKKNSNTVAGVVQLSSSSSSSNGRLPINKNLAGFCDKSLEFDASAEISAQIPALGGEGSRRDQKDVTSNKKAKKLFSKFVPKNLRVAKGGKAVTKAEPASDCSSNSTSISKGASSRRGVEEEPLEEEGDGGAGDKGGDKDVEEGGRDVLGFVVSARDQDIGSKDAALLGDTVGKPANGSSGYLVFFLLVLSGLAGGRVTALAVTVVWCLLMSSARGLWKSWKMQLKQV